jgi:hypothetical protein
MIVAPNESTELRNFQQLKLPLTFAPVLSFLAEGGAGIQGTSGPIENSASPEQYAGVTRTLLTAL